jgi:deoxyadenosine/deoxycytidine kinase
MEFFHRVTATEIDIVDIQGTIAAGKTSIASQVKKDPRRFVELLFRDRISSRPYTHVCVVPEPIEHWTCVGDDNEDLLASMYADARLNGMAFQMNVVNTQVDIMTEAIALAVIDGKNVNDHGRILMITERSTFCGRHIFAQMNRDNRKITAAHWKVYCDSYDAAHAKWRENIRTMFPDGVMVRNLGTVFLQISPKEAAVRAAKRDRPADRNLPFEVFEELERRHQDLYGRSNPLVRNMVTIVDSAALSRVLDRVDSASSLQLSFINK